MSAKRNNLVILLGQHIIECNKAGYKSYVNDLKPGEEQLPFSTYGTDYDTVCMSIRDFASDVQEWLEENQKDDVSLDPVMLTIEQLRTADLTKLSNDELSIAAQHVDAEMSESDPTSGYYHKLQNLTDAIFNEMESDSRVDHLPHGTNT